MKSLCCSALVNAMVGDRIVGYHENVQNHAQLRGMTFYWECDQCKIPCDIQREQDYKFCGE